MQNISAGQLLCGGLFSADCLSHWLSSVALSHALVANTNNKELLLRVHLAIAKDAAPVSLLQQAFNILQQVVKRFLLYDFTSTQMLSMNDLGGQVTNSTGRSDTSFHLAG